MGDMESLGGLIQYGKVVNPDEFHIICRNSSYIPVIVFMALMNMQIATPISEM